MSLNLFLKILGRFVALILLQVLILNNISITEYGITPFFYILFILLLPYDTSDWVLLVSGFLIGITMDMFCDTGGMHASASVLIAFLRPTVLKAFSLRDGYSPDSIPSLNFYGFSWFFRYSLVLIFVHHFTYYMMLEFSFKYFLITIIQVLITSIFTLFLIIVSQYLIFRR